MKAGIWRLADPKITLASVASLILGTAVAAHDGPLAWGWLFLSVIGIFCIEVAKNASGEIFDYDSGTDQAISEEDRSPFSGGKRVLLDKLLTRGQTWAVALVSYGIGAAVGLVIVLFREPDVVWLGLIGMGLAFFYHAPPLKLSYRGLGELAVGAAYGPVIACGTYLVQRGTVSSGVFWSSLPLGLLIATFLWINELPDHDADRSAGKRTLVVRLGKRRAGLMLPVLLGSAFTASLLLPIFGVAPGPTWLCAIALPFAIHASVHTINAHGRTRDLIAAQKNVLLTFLLASIGAAVGWLIA